MTRRRYAHVAVGIQREAADRLATARGMSPPARRPELPLYRVCRLSQGVRAVLP
jgi:hypothetical protein